MGCDIHLVIEEKRHGQEKWIGVLSTDASSVVRQALKVAHRDYEFFGRIAGVRTSPKDGKRHYPQNLPRDVSDLAWDHYMTAPTDHHTPSHMSADDFCQAWIAENHQATDVRKEYATYDLLGIFPEDGCDYRVVFWFDN